MNKFIIKVHNFIVRFLTSFIIVKEVRRRIRNIFLAEKINFDIDKGKQSSEWTTVWGEKAIVGKNTYFGPNVSIWHNDSEIGAFCSIASNIHLGTPSHPINWLTMHTFTYCKKRTDYKIYMPDDKLLSFSEGNIPITVGNDVWIGFNVIIRGG